MAMDLETSPARPRGRRYRWPCAAVPLALGAGAAAFASGATGSTRPSDLRQTGLRPPGLAARPPGRTYELQQKRAVDIETKVLTHKIQRGVDPGLFNPLFEEMNGMPCLDKVKEYHLAAAMDMVLEQFSKDVSRIHNSLFRKTTLKPKQLTFEEVFNPLEVCLDRVEKTWGAISLLRKSWRPSPEVDEIYHGLSYRVATAAAILSQSEILHQALYQLLQLSEGDLSEAQYRVARRVLWEGVTMGVEVADYETMQALDEGNKQLGYLSTVFAENLAHSEAQTLALRTERLSVEGLPEEVLREAAAAASASGQEATAEDGPWLFTCQRKVLGVLQSHAKDASLREEAFRARWRLGIEGYDAEQEGNLDVIAAMLEHRQFWATTLGFPNFADLAFESRMSTREEVEALLGVLREAAEAASKDELQELQVYAAEKGSEGELKAWDLAYWRRALIQERSDFQDADLKPYLPLPAVLRGLFSLLEHLFGVSFEAATGRKEVPLWHRSIRFFRLVDRELQFPFAGLYLDMFQHDEKLPSPDGGFTADSFVSYSPLLGKNNVPRRPIASIVGELAPPKKGAPTLLTLAQVRSLFHAAGSAMQHLLTIQDVGLAVGTQGMELDFVEFVPKFLELWASHPDTLRKIAKHWETGDPIPESLLEGLEKSQGLHRGAELLERVAWAQLDLDLHSSQDPSPDSIVDLARRRLTSQDLGHEVADKGLASFAGPFCTGFGAGEYAALWSEVLAADVFETFSKAAPQELPELGRRFREAFLEPGAGRAPITAFQDFQGRVPKVVPLLRRLNLQGSSS